MKAISVSSSCVLALLLSIAGCGGGSTPPPPCTGSSCPSTSSSDYLFESNNSQISAFQVDATTGTLLATLNPVAGPQSAGGIIVTSTNFLYVSDFINNAVYAFSVDNTSGTLTTVSGSPFTVGPGQGAGGLATDPGGKFLFVAESNANQLAAFTISSSGQLAAVAGSPFATGSFPVEDAVDPSGKFLYVSNNQDGLGSISGYTINSSTGVLTPISGSPFATMVNGGPVGLTVHPNGKFLYVAMGGTDVPNNQIVADSIDATTGALSPVTGSPFATGTQPSWVAINPAGTFLYSANVSDNNVSAFSVDANAGTLSQVSGSPYFAGRGPFFLVINSTGAVLFAANELAIGIPTFTVGSSGALTTVAAIQGSGGGSGLAIVHHP
jgi:6-phosphogluconolactonase